MSFKVFLGFLAGAGVISDEYAKFLYNRLGKEQIPDSIDEIAVLVRTASVEFMDRTQHKKQISINIFDWFRKLNDYSRPRS